MKTSRTANKQISKRKNLHRYAVLPQTQYTPLSEVALTGNVFKYWLKWRQPVTTVFGWWSSKVDCGFPEKTIRKVLNLEIEMYLHHTDERMENEYLRNMYHSLIEQVIKQDSYATG